MREQDFRDALAENFDDQHMTIGVQPWLTRVHKGALPALCGVCIVAA